MNGRVVHVKDNVPGAVYIGRRMPRQGLKAHTLHNPYRVEEWGRDGAIGRFSDALHNYITEGIYIDELISLRGKPLACWCRHDGEEANETNVCHGDVIIATLNKYTDEELTTRKDHRK